MDPTTRSISTTLPQKKKASSSATVTAMLVVCSSKSQYSSAFSRTTNIVAHNKNVHAPPPPPASGEFMIDTQHRLHSHHSRTSLSSAEHGVTAPESPHQRILRHIPESNKNSKRESKKKKRKKALRRKEKERNSLSDTSGEDSESQKKRNSKAFSKILNEDPSPTSVRHGLSIGYISVSSRLSASSAVNRGEMRTIIHSIRQQKNCIDDRAKSDKQLREVTKHFEEERQAMLLKWEAMSAERKLSSRSLRGSTS